MIVCIFSFNRGQFLANCVRSVEQCASGWSICVVDDESDDAETRRILEQIERRHRVIRARSEPGVKHGGLYANMQLALETFADQPLMLTLQDDTQMVRSIDAEDEKQWLDHFERNPQTGFVQPCFIRGINRQRDEQTMTYDHDNGVYWNTPAGQSTGVHYSDLHITKPGRLLSNDWQFADSEPANDRQASKQFGPMAQMHTPIAMWLPEVPAWRGKRKTMALEIAERRRTSGLYPFEFLTKAQVATLRQRSPDLLPVAEDCLTNTEPSLEQPWKYDPLQGKRWLKKLNSLEMRLHRLFG